MNSIISPAAHRWMVVDDNAELQELMSWMLASLGLAEVEGFECPIEAAARFQARGGNFDLVVTDRDMPGLDGLEFARRIHAQNPRTRTVLVTAHVDDLTPEMFRNAGICAVLPKPFSLARLETLVRTVACAPVEQISTAGVSFPAKVTA